MMKHFKVWLRPVGDACKLSVEGSEQADWLRARLQQQGMVCDEPQPKAGTGRWDFHATYTPQLPHAELRRFLDCQPEVEMMLPPA